MSTTWRGCSSRLYRTKTHAERFARLPPELFSRLADVLRPPGRSDIWSALRREFADGFRLLAARVQAEGLAPKLRARSRPARVSQSPFLVQQRAADAMLAAWTAGEAVPGPRSMPGEPNAPPAARSWRRSRTGSRPTA